VDESFFARGRRFRLTKQRTSECKIARATKARRLRAVFPLDVPLNLSLAGLPGEF
jgi:hypothetical protein